MIVALEGNIGAGKSTFLANLRDAYRDLCCYQTVHLTHVFNLSHPPPKSLPIIKFYDEPLPVELEDFYRGLVSATKIEAEFFRLKANLLKDILKELDPNTIYIIDSSVLSCIPYLQLHQKNSEVQKVWDFCLLEAGKIPHIVLYFKETPHALTSRIRQRGRPGEENITLNYLEKLAYNFDSLYCELLSKKIDARPANSADLFLKELISDYDSGYVTSCYSQTILNLQKK